MPFLWERYAMIIIILVTLILSVVLSLAVYKIKVVYAQRVRATGHSAGSYLPISINPAGVMPIIFAVAIVSVLSAGASFAVKYPEVHWLYSIAVPIQKFFANQLYYSLTLVISTLVFTVLSALIVLRPDDMAENLAKQGAFVLGLRPGKATELYLRSVILAVVTIGGVLLGILVVLPSLFRLVLNVPVLAITGSGILIVVSVIIDIIKQLQAVYANLREAKVYF